MAKLHLKTAIARLSASIVVLMSIFMIHSCRKNSDNKPLTGLNNPDIVLAKSWYENNLPISTRFHKSTSTGDTKPALNSLVKPNWKYAVSYTRLGKQVIEIPIDSANLLGVSLSKNFNFKRNPSKSEFLILNDGKYYSVYIMTILADSLYLQNDFSKLNRTSYAKRDKYFSGYVFYYTIAGQFLNGWHYANGKLDKSISGATKPTGEIQTAGLQRFGVKTRDVGCTISTFFVYMGSGTISVGSEVAGITYFFDEYIFDSCDGDMSFQQDPDGGGGIAPPDGSGSPTPADVNIKTDSLSKHFPCAVALIINNLAGCGVYSSFIQAFTTTKKPDLIWQDGALPWNAPISNSTSTTYDLGTTGYDGRSATITLNTSMLQNSSQLLIAAAAIHETLHAYINYNIETAVGGFLPPANYNSDGSWLYALDTWATINGLPSNYRDHYEMMTDYFNQAVAALGQLDNYAHSTKDYELAMLYGLDNAIGASSAQQTILQTEYNSLLSTLGVTPSDLNTFNINNLNSTSNKLPQSGCN